MGGPGGLNSPEEGEEKGLRAEQLNVWEWLEGPHSARKVRLRGKVIWEREGFYSPLLCVSSSYWGVGQARKITEDLLPV